ncbi:MAG: hypothetical protein HIU83_11895 [Proteobacteria bacterium]|nr:hypothetical protein [Pseudomonadota bacterium]
MKIISVVCSRFLILALTLLAGCGGNSSPGTTALSANNVNLIFVVSPDLAYNTPGDIQPDTANLTSQGLNRSLQMASYLKHQVLGERNATRIYTLQPMSHLQTANNYPDMTAITYIQQFAMLNQITLTGAGGYNSPLYTANSFPLNASYADPALGEQALPYQGLEFSATSHNNELLLGTLLYFNNPGFYVFSAPWETINSLMATLKKQYTNLTLPTAYTGSNQVYAISIKSKTATTAASASLVTFNSNLTPLASYPVLPEPVASAACPGPNTTPALFNITATAGATTTGINTNQTMYLIRHAEAHPWSGWDDGNYVAAGQWRALALPNALKGKLNPAPSVVYSIDPAQLYPGSLTIAGNSNFSYVRPSLTVAPYAIANNLPYYLVSQFELFGVTSPADTVQYFFFNPAFSGKTILLAWEHAHFPPIITALLAKYPNPSVKTAPSWPGTDYDTIWRVQLDGSGNLTVDNALCEGIDSASLPVTAPQF